MTGKATHNSSYKKLAVRWLIENSSSYQLLCWVDSFVLRNSLLRQALKRCVPYKFY